MSVLLLLCLLKKLLLNYFILERHQEIELTLMIQDERIKFLNDYPVNNAGVYVVYWMQASQRTHYNHALEYAVLTANEQEKPLIVFFGLTDKFPEANLRHYTFMIEGLQDVKSKLSHRGIKLIVRITDPAEGIISISKNASIVVTDRGYLRIQKHWRKKASELIHCPLIQVESDVIVPVQTASPKEEYSAGTFRPKMHRHVEEYLVPVKKNIPVNNSLEVDLDSIDILNIRSISENLNISSGIKPSEYYSGGENQAEKHLDLFLGSKINKYNDYRNDPNSNTLSNLSPYLHFGQISPLYIAIRIAGVQADNESKASFIDELIVRRELSINFTFYNKEYDTFESLPDWAKKSLNVHKSDPREYLYKFEQFENGETHDPYWNAAQKEMMITGKMHGYMRMYWGKKILEWSSTPEEAFRTALILNNKYEIDGRDPNSFAGVAWCFGKHDRPWAERPVFGKIRYMNANGLKRKFDADHYVRRINELT